MGLLQRLSMFGQQSPWAAMAQPQLQQAPPQMPTDPNAAVPYTDPNGAQRMGQTMMSAAPRQSSAQVRPPSFGERLNTWSESPLLQMGLSLLGNAQNGGDWGAVGQDLRQFGQDRTQRQRQANEDRRIAAADRREETQFSWMQGDRTQADQRRERVAAFIATRPPEEQAILQTLAPDEIDDYLDRQRTYGLQERQLQLQTEEARDNRAYRGASLAVDRERLASDRLANSADTRLGMGEAERINGWMARLDNWGMVENDIGALDEILQRNPAAFDQILDGDQAIVLARVRDPQMRRDLNTIYSVSANLAREELRGQTPVSNIDFLSAVRSNPNVQSGALFARDWLDRARQDRRGLESRTQSALQYRQGGGGRSLYEPDPETGQNWYQSQDGYTRFNRNPATNGGGGGGSGQTAEQRQAAAALAARQGGAAGQGFGRVGGNVSAPRLLREPTTLLERSAVQEYNTALQRGQTARARTLETRLRRAGLIP